MTRASWQSWDGRRLRWRVDAAQLNRAEVELWLDGVMFLRAPGANVGEYAFDIAPAGHAQMEFSLRSVDGEIMLPAWRVVHDEPAEPGTDQWQGDRAPLQPMPDLPLPDMQTFAQIPPLSIVVPVHNSAQIVGRCIESILRWSTGDTRLILIDDFSDDAAISPLLDRYASRARIQVMRNAQNLGYTRTCNLGIAAAGNDDILLLNADTEVGPRWLQRLRLIAYAAADIGTVTAVSDNAGAFSVPELEQYCPIPSCWSLEQTQRALLQQTVGCLPQLPSGNGFCMYIKRALLDRVGVLDADAFPCGYGEENDLCQRGEQAGFRHVIAGDVFVRHVRSASFGETRRLALGVQGMQILRRRYPDYEEKVGATLWSFDRRVLDYRVRRVYAGAKAGHAALPPRPRVLIVADSIDAAEPVVAPIQTEYEAYVLCADGENWRLFRSTPSGLSLLHACASDRGDQQLRQWLVRFAIELVYVLNRSPLDIISTAATVGVGAIESSNDADFQRIHEDAMSAELAFRH